MRRDRFTIDRHQDGFELLDHNNGSRLIFSREDAKFFFCWLMQRLNVTDAILFNGKSVKGFYQYDAVMEAIRGLEECSGTKQGDQR